jgi:hypothetical protein
LRLAFELAFSLGVGAVLLGVFGLLLAGLSRLALGRHADDLSFRENTQVNPSGAAFVFFWRLRRWAVRVAVGGIALLVPVGLLMLLIWGE